MEGLSDFERGTIVGTRLTGASVIKTGTLLVHQERQFLSLCWRRTGFMGRQHQRRGTVGENQQ
jgi:hypothetical protein